MKQFSKDLGNVSLAPKGKWSREQEYERLALVYNACDNLSYVAKIDVPSGVDIENREYWQPMNATGYADNNFINLTAENENGTITAYESLEEAVATILPINRRAGATLSFYNLNSDRLDRQAEFELWQFNSTDLSNWENRDYWNNVYYNWNVFVGWYIGADALKNHVKLPTVGQYAYVGSNLNDAVLYQCRTNDTWTNTGTKVRNYMSVVVSGNITIGDNGNWFSDGKDTGIPATPAVDEQLDNIGLQLQQHTTEIDKLQKQDVSLKSNIDSNFETINNKVDEIKTATDSKIDTADANLQKQITGNDNDIATLNTKHESLSKTVQGIAATGGASIATNVTYDKTNSGLNAENAQDAIDELQVSKLDKASVVQESGEAEDKVMSQKAVSDKLNDLVALDKSFISTAFIPQLGADNIGKPVGTLLNNCVVPEFTELKDIKSSETENNYKTYIYTNNTSSLQYIYTEFYSSAQYSTQYGKYMKCGLYNEHEVLIRSSIQDGKLLFALLPGYTLVISGDAYVQIPVNVSKYTVNDATYESYISKYVSNYATSYNRVLNFLYAESSGTEQQVSYKQNIFTATLSWKNVENCRYSYLSTANSVIRYRNNAEYKVIIRNTGNSAVVIGVGATRGSTDWSSGFFVEKHDIIIRPGESSAITLSKKDVFNLPPKENTHISILVVLFGSLGGNAFANGAGSLEVEIMWQENAMNAVNATNATNAGWVIGGLSSNAVLRDVPAEGGVAGAMTLEKIDNRTVHISTNIDSDTIGSRYRGIYWKIEYSNFEKDIKGIWKLTNQYQWYTNVVVVSEIKDWASTDAFSIDGPQNGKVEWNLYELIMNYKDQEEKKGPNSKWTGGLIKNGYFYIALIAYKFDGKLDPFEDTLTLDKIPSNSKVIATELSPKLDQSIKDAIESQSAQKIQVTNWGDSLTAGAGQNIHTNQRTVIDSIKAKGYPDLNLTEQSNITYSIMMQELLGDKYNVTNCGVGGENINTIAARLGANLVYSINDFVLPADTTPVQIGTYNDKLKSSWGTTIAPLLQGHGNSVNPCYVQGIECKLKWTGSNYDDINATYTLQRVSSGDRNVNFPAKTPIIFSGSKYYRNTKLAVLWCWQNGGYINDTELIEKLDKMIAHLNTSKYILVGLHSGTKSSREEQEDLLTSKYGDKFFNWRQYASTNALYDFGLTPSNDDLSAMEIGSMPPSLRIDSVHLCAAGYAILGYKIIERFKNLGYIL